MKPYFQRFRPCLDGNINILIEVVKGCGGKYGFASSHAANSMGLAVFHVMILKRKKIIGYFILTWALLVGYSSALTLYKYSGILVTGNMRDKQDVDKLNESYFRSSIPRGSFQNVYYSLTNQENLNQLDIIHELISQELNDLNSPLIHLKKDSVLGPLILDFENLYAVHVRLREEILNHYVLIL